MLREYVNANEDRNPNNVNGADYLFVKGSFSLLLFYFSHHSVFLSAFGCSSAIDAYRYIAQIVYTSNISAHASVITNLEPVKRKF